MFGWTHEDTAIELSAFAGRERVFCIAGGGCAALQLAAAGHEVTAVDVNPAQIAYVRERASGLPPRAGHIEALMARMRKGFPAIGWTPNRLRTFLHFDDPAAQADYWNRVLDTSLWRASLRTLLSRWVLRLAYAAPLVRALPRDFSAILRRRLARSWAAHPNRNNPYAWRMLTGAAAFDSAPGPQTIRLVCSDAAAFLESCRPDAFDAFSLSNVLDGASPEYAERLRGAVRQAGSRDAIVITRSFAELGEQGMWNRVADDRSLIWGSVDVRPVSEY
jgi:S-adenosylmethionine:diacylglycerol 3-amino-3-carboxypropyl transferase